MPARNIELTERFDRWIEAGVASGRYRSASEIIGEALRLLEQREREEQAKLEWLRGAVQQGIGELERGEGIEFRSIEDLEAYVHSLGEEARAEPVPARKSG